MIKNEKQYKISRGKLKDLERSLKVCVEGKHPDRKIRNAALGSIKSLMGDLAKEIKDYEKLKNKRVPALSLESLRDLPDVLVRSRISHGMTQKQLADKLGMPATQIQRYESENYQRASFATLLDISKTLKLDLDKGTKARIDYGGSPKKTKKPAQKA